MLVMTSDGIGPIDSKHENKNTIVDQTSYYVISPHQYILNLFPLMRCKHRDIIIFVEPCKL